MMYCSSRHDFAKLAGILIELSGAEDGDIGVGLNLGGRTLPQPAAGLKQAGVRLIGTKCWR
jgi:biotin-(acetyl-CoA carboxylase) ligase